MNKIRRALFWISLIVLVSAVWLLYPVISFMLSTPPEVHQLDKQVVERVKVIAHRGASGHAPENTLAAIATALQMGADIIEIDIHLSRDGELVVLHDETLDRTTNGSGAVHALSLTDLKLLDAGSWYSPDFAGEQIPTLSEVLKLINGQAVCLIEIKWAKDFLYEGIVEKAHQIIDEYKAASWCIIQSFEPSYLLESTSINPSVPIHQLIVAERALPLLAFHMDRKVKFGLPNTPSIAAINPFYIATDASMVARWHERGLKVYTYTVNEEAEMLKILEMGVDGIITNYPDRLVLLRDQVISQ